MENQELAMLYPSNEKLLEIMENIESMFLFLTYTDGHNRCSFARKQRTLKQFKATVSL